MDNQDHFVELPSRNEDSLAPSERSEGPSVSDRAHSSSNNISRFAIHVATTEHSRLLNQSNNGRTFAVVHATSSTKYVILDPVSGERQSLKLIDVPADCEHSHRYALAAQMLSLKSLDHPNVSSVLAAFQDKRSSRLYIVSQYFDGPCLSREVADSLFEVVDPTILLKILPDVAASVAYLHSCGVAHGNICPSNIVLTDGKARIVDVGLRNACGSNAKRTFVAPEPTERGEGFHSSASDDMWALGMTLLVCLTGCVPTDLEHIALPDSTPMLLRDAIIGALSLDATIRLTANDLLALLDQRTTLESGPRYLTVQRVLSFSDSDLETAIMLADVPAPVVGCAWDPYGDSDGASK